MKLSQSLMAALLVVFLATGCTNIFGGDDEGGSSSDDSPAEDDRLVQGQLVTADQSTQGVSAQQSEEADWRVLAVSWGADFEPFDLYSILNPNTDLESLSLDHWDQLDVIEPEADGSFQWTRPRDGGFVLFAVDVNDEFDPVKGLIGIEGEDNTSWQALDSEHITGAMDLGAIEPPDSEDELIWSADTTVSELAAEGLIRDEDTVLQLAYFNDGVRMLKNLLSVGYDIAADGVSRRDARVYVGLEYQARGLEYNGYEAIKNGYGPEEFVPNEFPGYSLYFIVEADTEPTLHVYPPEDITYQVDGSETLSADEGRKLDVGPIQDNDGNNIPGWCGARLLVEAGDRGVIFPEHVSGNWTLEVNGEPRAVNLDSGFSATDFDAGDFPLPVPELKVAVDSENLLETVTLEWHRVTASGTERLHPDAVADILGTGNAWLTQIGEGEGEEEQADRVQESLSVLPDQTSVQPEMEWKLEGDPTPGKDDPPYGLSAVGLPSAINMTHLWGGYDWQHESLES